MSKKISVVDTVRNMSDKELMKFIKNVHETGYYQGKENQQCDYLKALKILLTRV